MTTIIEVDRSGTWEAIDYSEFKIEVGVSDVLVSPTAAVSTRAREDLNANQPLRIRIDGSTVFEGTTESAGAKQGQGEVKVSVEHAAAALFEESVSFTSTAATDEDVLRDALAASEKGGDFTLSYAGSATSLNSEYDADVRGLRRVFRDMTDRTSRVWWVEPASKTIHVQPRGYRGLWKSLSASGDGVGVKSFDGGSVDTVRNSVEVTATGGEAVSATASNQSSIDEYGKRSESVNIKYADTQSEAQAYADELLVTEPLSQGEVAVPKSAGDVTQPLANYTVDLQDNSKGVDATALTVTKQTIKQGRATLHVGEGSGVSMANVNRKRKSRKDTTAPGSVYNSDRLADGSVLTSKLDDLAVELEKVAPESISETKVQDDAISTPKLQAGAVTADEILADTITANEIFSLNLATGTLTIGTDASAGFEFDVVNDQARMLPQSDGTGYLGSLSYRLAQVATQELQTDGFSVDSGDVFIDPESASSAIYVDGSAGTVTFYPSVDNAGQLGTSGNAFSEMHAYAFIDADSGSELSDGGSATDGLASMDTIPEFCIRRDDDGERLGVSVSDLSRWLFDVATEQEREIERLEGRVGELEERLSALESEVE